MANIVTVAVPAFIEESSEYDTQYKKDNEMESRKGFREKCNKPGCGVYRRREHMIWCMKVSMTERYSCLAYSNDIGVEMEDALAQDDEKTVESMVERTIRDALLVNPRTEWVRDFEFEWNGDSMNCSFKVKGKEWDKVFQINI